MQNPIKLADEYMTLVSERRLTVHPSDSHIFAEMHVNGYLEAQLYTDHGAYYKLNSNYCGSEGMVEDVAFLVEILREMDDNSALAHIIQYVAFAALVNYEEFSERVIEKVAENIGRQEEIEALAEE